MELDLKIISKCDGLSVYYAHDKQRKKNCNDESISGIKDTASHHIIGWELTVEIYNVIFSL